MGGKEGNKRTAAEDHDFAADWAVLERNDVEAGDEIEVSDVGGDNRVSDLKGGGTNEEVGKGEANAPCGVLAIDLAGTQSYSWGYWVEWHCRHDFVEKLQPSGFSLRFVRPCHAMRQFRKCQDGDGDTLANSSKGNGFEGLMGVLSFSFFRNENAGVEYQSHAD
jgi:hypothetical protein